MALRAVIFDYGMVLSGPPDAAAHDALVRLTGLPANELDRLYWKYRTAYDAGSLTGAAFWRAVAQDARIELSAAAMEELVRWDERMWMTVNPAMLAWQLELKQRGLLTAIVSNMGDTVHRAMARELDWLGRFDVLVWSYQLGITKPDRRIYDYVLEKLGTEAEEVLFLDDRPVNVEAAIALGMKGLVFSNVDRLCEDLKASTLGEELPLPG